ncbi:MAG: ABC transporter permease [Chryseolinea sp.]
MARLFITPGNPDMITNYISLAARTIRRSTSYTLVNVLGLTFGITCAIIIFSLVHYHLSFDTFHKDGDRIYRFVTEEHRDDVEYEVAVPPVFGKAFREDYTFGEKVARVCAANSLLSFETHGTQHKFQEDIAFTEASYLDIFNFPLISGTNALDQPGTAIISERVARKFFGEEPALGKVFRFENRSDFRVVAIMADLPGNTDLRSDILLTYQNIKDHSQWYAADDAWSGIASSIKTYTRLRPGVDPGDVEKEISGYVKKYRAKASNVHHYKLQPLADLHFSSLYNGVISKTILWVLSIIGFFLVLTACLNFVNLATAQSVSRSREVGVRKALGGLRMQLFWQFTMETSVIVFLSFFVSLALATALIPMVNDLLETRIDLSLSDPMLWGFIGIMIAIVTLLAGAYPGIVLSSFKPVQALKGVQTGSETLNIRRILITTQFSITHMLLIGLIVVLSQVSYFHNSDLGYEKKSIVILPMGSHDQKSKTLKEQFMKLPNVEQVTLCYSAPAAPYSWETSFVYDHRSDDASFGTRFKAGDEDYLSTFNLELVSGRNLSPSDTIREFLVNETFVSRLGETSESVLGKNIAFNDRYNGAIVGVLADYQDESLHTAINPVMMTSSLNYSQVYAVKINMNEMSGTLAALDKTWSATYPDQLFAYDFLDDQIANFYKTEDRMLGVVEVFAFIALIVGCIGLYGLASFMASRKTKEIGIRKVLGGSVQHIVWLFWREFGLLVLFAFLVAAPASGMLMSTWLSNYPNRINMGAWIFGLDLLIVVVVVLITVGFRTVKAARMNPAGALRTE